jgi:hypothetical protein
VLRSRIGGLLCIVIVATVALGGCGGQGSTRRIGTGSPFPSSCSAPLGTPSITLSDTIPSPTVTVVQGSRLVVIVPGIPDVNATNVTATRVTGTDVTFDRSIMTEECSTVLSDSGRRTVLLATHVGKSHLFATINPVGDTAAPAWLGTAVVIR